MLPRKHGKIGKKGGKILNLGGFVLLSVAKFDEDLKT